MLPYVTPERFRTMGLGSDLDGLEDFELRSILAAGTSLVNTYCNVPLLPSEHDFRGGSITDEQHTWNDRDLSRRVYVWHRPVRTITSMRVMATNTQYVLLTASDLFVNPTGNYCEVISLAFSSYGLWGAAIPGIGLYTPISRTSYTYGYRFPVSGELLDPTDAWTYRAQNQWWSVDPAVIYVNGSVVTTGFTIDRNEGSVTFDAAHDDDDIITADYVYTLPREIAQATAITAATALADRDLMLKGLGRLAEISVEEVRLRRESSRGRGAGAVAQQEAIPESARALLDGFRYVTAM